MLFLGPRREPRSSADTRRRHLGLVQSPRPLAGTSQALQLGFSLLPAK